MSRTYPLNVVLIHFMDTTQVECTTTCIWELQHKVERIHLDTIFKMETKLICQQKEHILQYAYFKLLSKIAFSELILQFLLAERATQIIKDHAENHSEDPLFMYLPFLLVHYPLQVPKNYSDLYPHVQNKDRKIYSGKSFLLYLTYKIKVVCSNIIS